MKTFDALTETEKQRICNAHEELLAALQEATHELVQLAEESGRLAEYGICIDRLRKQVDKAKTP